MARIDDFLTAAVKSIGPKPPDDATQGTKNPWNLAISNAFAQAIAQELRERGMKGARPGGPGELGVSGPNDDWRAASAPSESTSHGPPKNRD